MSRLHYDRALRAHDSGARSDTYADTRKLVLNHRNDTLDEEKNEPPRHDNRRRAIWGRSVIVVSFRSQIGII